MKKHFLSYGKKALSLATAVVVLLGTTLTITGCGNTGGTPAAEQGAVEAKASENAGAVKLRLGVMTGNIEHLISVIGREKGFFEKNGIDLEVTEYAAGINSVDALTMDQLDVALAADFAILNRIGNTEGSDLKIITSYAYAAGAGGQLFVNPERIKDENDFKGKKLINLPGVVYEYWNELVRDKYGLTADELEFVNVDSQPSAVAVATRGDGDAFWGSGEVAAQLAALGWTPILNLSDLNAMTTMFFIAKEGYAKENSDTLKKFYAGVTETIEYIQSNTDDAAAIIESKAGLKPEMFKQIVAAMNLGIQFNTEEFEYLDGVNKWLQEKQYYKNPFDVKDILYLDTAKEAYPDKFDI